MRIWPAGGIGSGRFGLSGIAHPFQPLALPKALLQLRQRSRHYAIAKFIHVLHDCDFQHPCCSTSVPQIAEARFARLYRRGTPAGLVVYPSAARARSSISQSSTPLCATYSSASRVNPPVQIRMARVAFSAILTPSNSLTRFLWAGFANCLH